MADVGYSFSIDSINQIILEVGGVTQPANKTVTDFVTDLQASPYPWSLQLNSNNVDIDMCIYGPSSGFTTTIVVEEPGSGTPITLNPIAFTRGRPTER